MYDIQYDLLDNLFLILIFQLVNLHPIHLKRLLVVYGEDGEPHRLVERKTLLEETIKKCLKLINNNYLTLLKQYLLNVIFNNIHSMFYFFILII